MTKVRLLLEAAHELDQPSPAAFNRNERPVNLIYYRQLNNDEIADSLVACNRRAAELERGWRCRGVCVGRSSARARRVEDFNRRVEMRPCRRHRVA